MAKTSSKSSIQMGHEGKLIAGAGLLTGMGALFAEMALLSMDSLLFVFNSEESGIGWVLKRFGGLMIIEDRVSFACEVDAEL